MCWGLGTIKLLQDITYNTSIPAVFQCYFESLMFQSFSSSPLMCLGKQWEMAKVLETVRVLGSWILPRTTPAIATTWEVNQQVSLFSLSPPFLSPVCLCVLSPFKENK